MPNRAESKPKIDAALMAKNIRTRRLILGGMFAFYNVFFAGVTALAPNPSDTASRAFNFVGGNCFGLTDPLPAKQEKPMWAPLAVASCGLVTAGLPGTAVGSLAPNRTPASTP